MTRDAFFLFVVVGASAVAACGGSTSSDLTNPDGSAGVDAGDAGTSATDGLPCDVDQLLSASCRSCHSSPPTSGAPMPMVTYADLIAPAKTQPQKKVAQLAAERMASTTAPMPATGQLPVAQIATMQNWVNAGMPTGGCGIAGTDPLSSPPVCTSGANWTRGNHGSVQMHPGDACITCHATSGGEAPTFTAAGTVFPSGHEPNDCNGLDPTSIGLEVVLTDANGKDIPVSVNSVGNFYYTGALAIPFTARLTENDGKVRAMATPQTSGDCNSCHTQTGANGAPGRITAPF
jgi:hypothetical protein